MVPQKVDLTDLEKDDLKAIQKAVQMNLSMAGQMVTQKVDLKAIQKAL